MINSVFGRLTVIAELPNRTQDRRIQYECLCSCGNETISDGRALRSGKKKSCGCLHKEQLRSRSTTHGKTSHPLYVVWSGMKQRCYNQNHNKYVDYGGRGITVCDRWLNSFPNFLEDMGERPEGLSLDRKDNNEPYCKANCRWATVTEQANNRRARNSGNRSMC